MGPGSKAKRKKTYLSPTFTKLTPEQAEQFVAERTHRNDREAAEFLESLRQEQPQNEKKHRPNDREEKNRQRSA